MADMEKLSADELETVAGGAGSSGWKQGIVVDVTDYLALRSQPVYDHQCEIGRLHNGDIIQVRPEIRKETFIYAKALGKQGWVNRSNIFVQE